MQLKPSPWKHLLLLAACSVFVALAFALGSRHPLLALCTGAFFGSGVVMALLTLVPGSSYLRLESDRMSVRTLYRTWHVQRSDIGAFFVAPVGGRNMVCWKYAMAFATRRRSRALSRAIAGVEAGLPDTYGHTAEELAGLLNRWLADAAAVCPDNSSGPTPLRHTA